MKKFLSNSFIVSFFLLLSKILGFVRDMLLATFFGSSMAMQAFLVAFRIPEFMRKVTSSGAITQVLNPYIKTGVNNKRQKVFVASVLFVIAIVMLVVTVFCTITESWAISIYAAGFDDDALILQLSSSLFEIMIPYVLFIFLVSLISAVLNSHHKYIVASVVPIVLNVVMIIAIVLSQYFAMPIYVIAYGVLIAGVLQLIIAMYALYSLLGSIKLSKEIILLKDIKVKIFFRKFPSAFIGASVLQISSLLETFFASFMLSGSLAWLYYADRVNQFLYGVFGTAIATVMIPYLLRYKNDKQEFVRVFKKIFNFTIFVAVPAVCGLAVLSKPIVITLFGYGKFNLVDISNTQIAMLGYSVSLLCFILIRVITSAIYVSNKSSAVFRLSLICLMINICLGVGVITFLANSDYGFVALAIVTSAVALINLTLQIIILSGSSQRFFELFVSVKYFLKIIFATVCMLGFIVLVSSDANQWLEMSLITRFVRLWLIIFCAVTVYLVVMFVCKANKDIAVKNI